MIKKLPKIKENVYLLKLIIKDHRNSAGNYIKFKKKIPALFTPVTIINDLKNKTVKNVQIYPQTT